MVSRFGLQGIPGERAAHTARQEAPKPLDPVKRQFTRAHANQLRVTNVTKHCTREGKIYCSVVLDTFSRKVAGWAIDSPRDAVLVTNALAMAIGTRGHVPLSVWFLDTARVSCSSLGSGEFGEDHRLVENLDQVVHGGRFEHGSFGEVVAF